MNKSKIEWCDYTWNPVTGCLHGCDYCYARRIAERFRDTDFDQYEKYYAVDCTFSLEKPKPRFLKNSFDSMQSSYPYGFRPTLHKYRLNEPQKLKKPSKIFVVSMGDLFGDWVPGEWIEEVFKACEAAPQHTYMFLTKNPGKYGQLYDTYGRMFFPDNAYFGATADTLQRFETAINTFFYIKNDDRKEGFQEIKTFISAEPLLEDVGAYDSSVWTNWIEWMIVGAQTGPGAKQPNPEWAKRIIDECNQWEVPLFLKNNLNWFEKIQEIPEGM